MKITIIDYEMVNLGSITNILKRLGYRNIVITNSLKDILKADKIILPGVGHFSQAMQNLGRYRIIEALKKKALDDKIPFLGICLGMQLMTKDSEEGHSKGLGFIEASTKKIIPNNEIQNIKVPHMGWNTLKIKKENQLLNKSQKNRFYFVHSYYVECKNREDILATTDHGTDFTAAFIKENLIGVQFHPEKSHRYGLEFFKNFLEKM